MSPCDITDVVMSFLCDITTSYKEAHLVIGVNWLALGRKWKNKELSCPQLETGISREGKKPNTSTDEQIGLQMNPYCVFLWKFILSESFNFSYLLAALSCSVQVSVQ